MSDSWINGALAGLFAAWVFFIVMRLLPAKWVRYQVSFGETSKEVGLEPLQWLLTVHLDPPKWKRIIMDPLCERLLVQVKLGQNDWLQSKWVEGDTNVFNLTADSAMSVLALIFTEQNGIIYIADYYPNNEIVQDGSYDFRVRIIRNRDNSVAAECGIAVIKLNQRISAAIANR